MRKIDLCFFKLFMIINFIWVVNISFADINDIETGNINLGSLKFRPNELVIEYYSPENIKKRIKITILRLEENSEKIFFEESESLEKKIIKFQGFIIARYPNKEIIHSDIFKAKNILFNYFIIDSPKNAKNLDGSNSIQCFLEFIYEKNFIYITVITDESYKEDNIHEMLKKRKLELIDIFEKNKDKIEKNLL